MIKYDKILIMMIDSNIKLINMIKRLEYYSISINDESEGYLKMFYDLNMSLLYRLDLFCQTIILSMNAHINNNIS